MRFGACGLLDTETSVLEPPGAVYFLVTGRAGTLESSYGRDSLGRERPAARALCP